MTLAGPGEPPRTSVLLVEDDQQVASTISEVLAAHGYDVHRVATGSEAQKAFRAGGASLVILDLRLPDVDGLILCLEFKRAADTPIIICSGRTEQSDRVLGLKLGADDFIPKPFDVEELVTRVATVLRRSTYAEPAQASTPPQEIRVGGLVIDVTTDRVTANGARVHLTPTEHRLLIALASRAGQVLSREELAREVWPDKPGSSGAVNFHVCHLRAKLARAMLVEPAIVSTRHVGYTLETTRRATSASAD
jgi:DNA-binding response OmpR family regulator